MNESAHWYNPDASSAHRMVGKNGKERATTIRDAREKHLLPSVTTILSILAKPELEQWKMRQVALAALTHHPAADTVFDDTYLDTIINDAFEQVEDAADLGTGIHAALGDWLQHKEWNDKFTSYVSAVIKWVEAEKVVFDGTELRLANREYGFAGTTDAPIRRGDQSGILDFKSRKTKPEYPCTPWAGQAAQIAAYYVAKFGLIQDNACGVNVFISTTEPGRVEACWYDAATLRCEWEFFQHCAALWRHVKQYDPRHP